jgi:hypothetical protein
MNVSKLKIVSYDDPKTKKVIDSMDAMINPETYNQKVEIKYSDKQAQGTTGKLPKFTKINPDKIDFELLFDRTGIINDLPPGDVGVDEDISKLKKLTVEYQGKNHRPRFVGIYWGTLKFDGCLETMDITYKLFNAEGMPLRAVVKTSFLGSIEDDKRLAKENSQSPDLTHVRTIKEGDTLPLLVYEMYGDQKYYIEVANFNNLKDFRYLKTGDKIKFPPIAK